MDLKGLKLNVLFQSILPVVIILFSGIDVIDTGPPISRFLQIRQFFENACYHVLKQALSLINSISLASFQNQYVKESLVNHN